MSVLAEFSMSPMDKGESVSEYVARSLEIVAESGVAYKLGPMGTCRAGAWDEPTLPRPGHALGERCTSKAFHQ